MSEEELKELRDIKKLLIVSLLKSGVSAESIAQLLDIDRGDFSREFPVRKLLKPKN
jgi:hypothetical protein